MFITCYTFNYFLSSLLFCTKEELILVFVTANVIIHNSAKLSYGGGLVVQRSTLDQGVNTDYKINAKFWEKW